MPNKSRLNAEMKKQLEDWWMDNDPLDFGQLSAFLATALKEQKKATLKLLDKAELEKWFDMPDTTENWKTWKKIRNTINDSTPPATEERKV